MNDKQAQDVVKEVVKEIEDGPTTTVEIPIAPVASGSFIESLPIETQLHLFKVKAANFEISALNNSLSALSEAQRRTMIEAQTIPTKIQETQQLIEGKKQSGLALYNELKKLLDCPEDKDVNLDTGEFV